MTDAVGLVVRILAYAAVFGIVGAVVFRLVLIERSAFDAATVARCNTRAAHIAESASVLLLVCGVVRLVVQTSEMRFPGDSWIDVGWQMLRETKWGWVWFAQMTTAAIIVALSARAGANKSSLWMSIALLSVALALTFSLSSHAMSAHRLAKFAVVADATHLLGAATWLGTLMVMCMSVVRNDGSGAGADGQPVNQRSQYIIQLLQTFSPVALMGAALVVSSGVLSSFAHLPNVSDITSTTYGKTLLAKVASVGVVVLFGWRNWKYVTPSIGREGPRRITRSMVAELAVTLVVLVLTALLVVTPPPMEMAMP